jgi:lipoate-protein ligase B
MIKVVRLGRTSYTSALELQNKLLKQVRKTLKLLLIKEDEYLSGNKYSNHYLIFVEHPPVYTSGRRSCFSEEQIKYLKNTGAECHQV